METQALNMACTSNSERIVSVEFW